MANKTVPRNIVGVELNAKAQERTSTLLRTLAEAGAAGVDEPELSMIDRFRLLASAYFDRIDGVPSDSRATGTE